MTENSTTGSPPPRADSDTVDNTVDNDTAHGPPRGFWAGRAALVIPAVVIALGFFLVYGIYDMEIVDESELFGPRSFPWITAGACFIVGALLIVSILRNPEAPEVLTDDNGRRYNSLASNWTATSITVGSFVMFGLLLEPAGWIIAGALVFWGITIGLGSRRYVFNLLVGLAISSIMQLIFAGLLGLNLPPGVMGMF
jgi:putative tricarboxylic transport membrane protein